MLGKGNLVLDGFILWPVVNDTSVHINIACLYVCEEKVKYSREREDMIMIYEGNGDP